MFTIEVDISETWILGSSKLHTSANNGLWAPIALELCSQTITLMAHNCQPQPTSGATALEHLSQRVVHPQDSHTVATARNDVSEPSHRTSTDASPADLLFFQARAFLEAAEDVDVEPETIQELVQLLTDREVTGKPSSESPDLESDDGDEEYDPEKGIPELDISALFTRKGDGMFLV